MSGWFLVSAVRLGAELSGVFPARPGSVYPTGRGASVRPTASASSDRALPARRRTGLGFPSSLLSNFSSLQISTAPSPTSTFPFPKSPSPFLSTFSKLFFLPSLDVSSESSLSPLPFEPKSGFPRPSGSRARIRGPLPAGPRCPAAYPSPRPAARLASEKPGRRFAPRRRSRGHRGRGPAPPAAGARGCGQLLQPEGDLG